MSIIQKIKRLLRLPREVEQNREEIEKAKRKLLVCRVKQEFPVGTKFPIVAEVLRLHEKGCVECKVYVPSGKAALGWTLCVQPIDMFKED